MCNHLTLCMNPRLHLQEACGSEHSAGSAIVCSTDLRGRSSSLLQGDALAHVAQGAPSICLRPLVLAARLRSPGCLAQDVTPLRSCYPELVVSSWSLHDNDIMHDYLMQQVCKQCFP